jgi:hypothetical protein
VFTVIGTVAAASVIAGFVAIFAAQYGTVGASTRQPATEAERFADRQRGPACSPRGWPCADRDCAHDTRQPTDQPHAARVATILKAGKPARLTSSGHLATRRRVQNS